MGTARVIIALLGLSLIEIKSEGCRQICFSKGLRGAWDERVKKCFCGKYYEYPNAPRDYVPLPLIEPGQDAPKEEYPHDYR